MELKLLSYIFYTIKQKKHFKITGKVSIKARLNFLNIHSKPVLNYNLE